MADNVALSVVLPVYNEAGGIVILIREIVDVLVSDFNIRSEIVVVDDASEDGSATIVETATCRHKKSLSIPQVTSILPFHS